jgi:pantetheine-phosphate adenylyltransferase
MYSLGLDNPDTNPILAKLHPILDHHRTNLSCPNLTPTSPPETLARDAPAPAPISTEETPTGPFPTSALGGTFDHLHAAHKLLLHLALFLTSKKLIVGVMAQHLLSGKNCSELVQPLEERIRGVEEFLTRIGGTTSTTTATTNPHLDEEGRRIQLDVVEIQDPFGPTAWDSDIQCLVVSKETLSGGRAVNVKRKDKGLGELEVFVIDVIAANQIVDGAGEGAGVGDGLKGVEDEKELKELKMGSTAIRQWIRDHHSDQ